VQVSAGGRCSGVVFSRKNPDLINASQGDAAPVANVAQRADPAFLRILPGLECRPHSPTFAVVKSKRGDPALPRCALGAEVSTVVKADEQFVCEIAGHGRTRAEVIQEPAGVAPQ